MRLIVLCEDSGVVEPVAVPMSFADCELLRERGLAVADAGSERR